VKARLIAALARLDARVLLGGMVVLLALVAGEGWLLVLRSPLAEYQRLTVGRDTLASSLRATPSEQGQLTGLAAELRAITTRLGAQLRPAGRDEEIASTVMAELDRAASLHGITLAGIHPGARRQVQGFEEILFEVTAQGRYLQLCQWLMDFEHTLGQSATVSEFAMKSLDEGRLVALSLKVALYRPLPDARAAKQ
jgi:Tfp pilus assembly protein PilO